MMRTTEDVMRELRATRRANLERALTRWQPSNAESLLEDFDASPADSFEETWLYVTRDYDDGEVMGMLFPGLDAASAYHASDDSSYTPVVMFDLRTGLVHEIQSVRRLEWVRDPNRETVHEL